jgi:hypothetical protein
MLFRQQAGTLDTLCKSADCLVSWWLSSSNCCIATFLQSRKSHLLCFVSVCLFVSFSLFFLVSGSFSHLCHISRAKGGRGMRQLRLSFTCPPNTKNVMVGHSNKKDEIRINVRSFWIQQDIYQGGTVLWSLPNCCLAATVVLGGYLLPTQECEMRFQTNTLERWGPERGECTWGVYQFLCEGGGEEKKINKGGMSRV